MRPGTPSASSVSRDRSSGQRRSAAAASTAIRLCSSGIDRSPLRSPASTCATGTPASPAASRARRASSWCRRRRASSRAAPARAPRRSRAASSRRRRCAGRAGSAAPAARAPRRRRRRGRDPSAGRCGGPTSSIPASRSAALTGPGLDELRTVADDGEDLHGREATMAAPFGPLAQLVEQGTLNPKVAGSIPARPMSRSPASPSGLSTADRADCDEQRSRTGGQSNEQRDGAARDHC